MTRQHHPLAAADGPWSVDLRDVVIAINEADQVIDVGPSSIILMHVEAHFDPITPVPSQPGVPGRPRLPGQPAAEPEDPRAEDIIEFFNADGEELQLVVANAWHQFRFRPSGRQIRIEHLRGRMQAILDLRRAAIDEQPLHPVLHFPTASTWEDYLAACAALIAGRGEAKWPPHDPHDRRNWFHNMFVHGGNP